MSWYEVYKALTSVNGIGPWGTIEDTLKREYKNGQDPNRSLNLALQAITPEEFGELSHRARGRIGYWRCLLQHNDVLASPQK